MTCWLGWGGEWWGRIGARAVKTADVDVIPGVANPHLYIYTSLICVCVAVYIKAV